jgi:hypothetical protein
MEHTASATDSIFHNLLGCWLIVNIIAISYFAGRTLFSPNNQSAADDRRAWRKVYMLLAGCIAASAIAGGLLGTWLAPGAGDAFLMGAASGLSGSFAASLVAIMAFLGSMI